MPPPPERLSWRSTRRRENSRLKYLDVRIDPIRRLPQLVAYATVSVEVASWLLYDRFSTFSLLLILAACTMYVLPVALYRLACAGLTVTVVLNGVISEQLSVAVLVIAFLWLFKVAVDRPIHQSIAVSVVLGTAICALQTLPNPWSVESISALAYALWAAVATAVGSAVQSHRLYVAGVEDRAVRAEATKEEAVRRRVVEERLEIARELHDIVAHHISVVGMQIELARTRLDGTQPRVDAALSTAHRSTGTVITELHEILQVLRRPGQDSPDERRPFGGRIEELTSLVASFDSPTRPANITVRGTPPSIDSPSLDMAAYRVLQEGLTNAHKHGDGWVEVSIEYAPDGSVTIVIRNQIRLVEVASTTFGFGLIGMAERVRAVGGTLDTGAQDRAFTVRARLPARARTKHP